ncbi:MAG: site-specific integrase [Pirellulales bacterium]
MSAATFNQYVAAWVSFGHWLVGKRLSGKRPSLSGEMRLLVNPFDGMGKLDERSDRRRTARALSEEELTRLLDAAKRRPLEDARTVRRGPNKGKQTIDLSAERIAKLTRIGQERALIYKTAILTGLRLNELRTLDVGNLSFGDVPFVRLDASKEKNRKGSTLPLRSDLAAELKEWTKGKPNASKVFTVPTGLLRILNRDLSLAGIPKRDADGTIVHIHSLRHSFGTHLSKAGVAPRTAQGLMRHSRIELTMNTYTDARLLDTSAAIESVELLKTDLRTVAPIVAPTTAQTGQKQSLSDNLEAINESDQETKKPSKSLGNTGFLKVEDTRLELVTSTMPL